MIIIISGADGVGKSTIIKQLSSKYKNVEVKWMRHNKFLSRFFNFFMKLLGKNYIEKIKGIKFGYHNYEGILAYPIIILTLIDYYLFLPKNLIFFSKFINKNSNKFLIIDRYLTDTICDLIISTKKPKLVCKLFSHQIFFLKKITKIIFLYCDYKIVTIRRPEIKFDRSYKDKMKAYKFVKEFFQFKVFETSNSSIESISEDIFEQIKNV